MSTHQDEIKETVVTDTPDQASDAERSTNGGWLMLAAIAVVAVPVLIGFLFLRGGDDDVSPAVSAVTGETVGGGAMGGGMGDTPSAVAAGDTATPAAMGDVRSFADIQATDIVIEPDGAGAGAVLRVVTSLDVACAVSFGPTGDLGSIATDTDMAGGGHTNHQPLMRGLEAGTTYFYQVAAIAPDGALYQSDVMQFTYEPGADAVATVRPPAPNVADAAVVVDFSSEYSDSYAASNAIDGSLSTEWSSAGDGDDTFIVLDFGEEMRIQGVGFRTREMTDGTAITTSFTVTVDGKKFGPFDAGPGLAVGLFDVVGTKVRIDVETSTGGNTGAVEIEVYGEPDM